MHTYKHHNCQGEGSSQGNDRGVKKRAISETEEKQPGESTSTRGAAKGLPVSPSPTNQVLPPPGVGSDLLLCPHHVQP